MPLPPAPRNSPLAKPCAFELIFMQNPARTYSLHVDSARRLFEDY